MKKLITPCKIIIVGASHTGKTFLVRHMIVRGDFGNKRDMVIVVASPSQTSLDQRIWTDLAKRGFKIIKINCAKQRPVMEQTELMKTFKHKLWVVDDVDNIKVARDGWIRDLFTLESHHSGYNVVMISHKLNSGCPEARDSADYIILTRSPNIDRTIDGLYKSARDKDECEKIIKSNLGYGKPISCDSSGDYNRAYEHIVIMRLQLFDSKGMEWPHFYKIPKDLFTQGLINVN